MIQLQQIDLEFSDKSVFRRLDWHIRRRERIGLVGDNGTGKTTLMRMIVGEMEPDKGRVIRNPRVRIGYLAQQFTYSSNRPLLELVIEAAGDLRSMEREILQLQQALSGMCHESEEQKFTLKRLGHLQELFEHRDGFRVEAEARSILQGLGFAPDVLERPLDTFSGGWQMRAAMARLLLSAPDLLLLDEPTNHLDTDALEWLERYLRAWEGTVVTVSHDRFFLDRTVSRIAELENCCLSEYHGNYSEYRRLKEGDQDRRMAEYHSRQDRIAELERFVERFRYKSSKARQVQSRVKQLEKLKEGLPVIQHEARGLRFRFPSCERSGDTVLELKELGHAYGENEVFSGLNLHIRRGERVALVGPNGAGKSTLTRLISGMEQAVSGEVKLGHKVELEVYTQEVEQALRPEFTVMQSIEEVNRGLSQTELRNLLGRFLFSGDSVFKTVNVLSGGEKSRLAVARLMMARANLLVLDEPTNHLDLKAKNTLQQALHEFQGTVLVVSHDRYFLDGVVTRVLELREGVLHDFAGNYSDYLQAREEAEAAAAAREAAAREQAGEVAPAQKPRSREERKRATDEKIRRGRILREVQKGAELLESRIAKIEKRMGELEQALMQEDVYNDPQKMKEAGVEYARLREEHSELFASWEEAQQRVEDTKTELDS